MRYLLQGDYAQMRATVANKFLALELEDDSYTEPPPVVKGPAAMSEEQIMDAFRQCLRHFFVQQPMHY